MDLQFRGHRYLDDVIANLEKRYGKPGKKRLNRVLSTWYDKNNHDLQEEELLFNLLQCLQELRPLSRCFPRRKIGKEE